jgi:hypothetical protein
MDALEKLVAEGFVLRSLPAYPRHLRVEKHNCAALVELTPEGRLKQFSAAGYLVDGQIALLVERDGRQVFAYKAKQVEAEGGALENFRRFERELNAVLEDQ